MLRLSALLAANKYFEQFVITSILCSPNNSDQSRIDDGSPSLLAADVHSFGSMMGI